jgi:hypothetical protein
LSSFAVTTPTSIDLDVPRVLKSIKIDWQEEISESSSSTIISPIEGSFRSLSQQDEAMVSFTLSLIPKIEIELEDAWGKNIPAQTHLFFLKKEEISNSSINSKVGANAGNWPTFKPKSFLTTVFGKTEKKEGSVFFSRALQVNDLQDGYGYAPTNGNTNEINTSLIPISINIPPCLTDEKTIQETKKIKSNPRYIEINLQKLDIKKASGEVVEIDRIRFSEELTHEIEVSIDFTIPSTAPNEKLPTSGIYTISSSVEPYKFGWFLVKAITFDASVFA